MKKLLTTLFAAIGIGASATANVDQPIQTIDSKSIKFTMPTVAADNLIFVMPTKESFEGAPQFHEDEWCQTEFYPYEKLPEIQKYLAEYKIFEKKNKTQYGWNDIYARKINRASIFKEGDAINQVAESIGATILPAPILTTTSNPLGQVKGGFTLELPGSVFLYGLGSPQEISALGAIVSHGGDDYQLTKAFMELSKKYHLILVDWRAQQILVSVSEEGKINAWRP